MNLFIFHRDLRLFDNTSLIKQLKKYGQITPAFIFTPEQIDSTKNKYYSSNSVQFMIESLKDLDQQIKKFKGKMNYFYGDNIKVLESIFEKIKIKSISFNKDYTPYSKKRDKQIIQWAQNKKIQVITSQDYALYNLCEIDFMSKNGQAPTFTPFKLHCFQNLKVRQPEIFQKFQFQNFNELEKIQQFYDFYSKSLSLYDHNQNLAIHGGRQNALKIINNLINLKNYIQDRNYPALPALKLSAYLHFTNVSIREVYYKALQVFGKQHHLIFELHCREFFTYITQKFPHVLLETQQKNLKKEFNQIKWNEKEWQFNRWKQGKTGIPFVDAGMRQMNATGYMHNRTRQNVACFLVKDLLIDWRQGQKYFANKLVDYSPTQNSGNWQYVAGVGTDPRQIRIFNPWLQAQKYDPDCAYIKKWIPELKQVPTKDILKWNKNHEYYLKNGTNYFAPIINHQQAIQQTQFIYNKIIKHKKQMNKHQKNPKYIQKINK